MWQFRRREGVGSKNDESSPNLRSKTEASLTLSFSFLGPSFLSNLWATRILEAFVCILLYAMNHTLTFSLLSTVASFLMIIHSLWLVISRFTAYYSQARSLESRKNKVTIIVSEIVCVFVSELNRMRIERYGAKLTYDNADVDVDIDVNEREDPPARLQFCQSAGFRGY